MASPSDMRQLFEIWDKAIATSRADHSGVVRAEAALRAMSWGAYYDSLYERDPLLSEIHYNFGLLEAPGPDDDPENEKLWLAQEQLIVQAKEKYHTN